MRIRSWAWSENHPTSRLNRLKQSTIDDRNRLLCTNMLRLVHRNALLFGQGSPAGAESLFGALILEQLTSSVLHEISRHVTWSSNVSIYIYINVKSPLYNISVCIMYTHAFMVYIRFMHIYIYTYTCVYMYMYAHTHKEIYMVTPHPPKK